MAASKLSQVLTLFEETKCPLTMKEIAFRLEVSPAQLDGMLRYWVRKNRIREAITKTDCSTCSNGQCPFVMAMPRSYELVTDDMIQVEPSSNSCDLGGCNCH